MGADEIRDFKRVPTVGLQPRKVQIHGFTASAVVVCDCGNPAPILIPNVDRAAACKKCKQQYVIASIDFRNEQGNIVSNVEIGKWAGASSASPHEDIAPKPKA